MPERPLGAVNRSSPALASQGVNRSQPTARFHGSSFQMSAAAVERAGGAGKRNLAQETWRKESRRHTEIMTGEGGAQRRWYNAGGTLCVILPLYAGGTSLSGMSLLSPQHLLLSLKPWQDRKGGGKHMVGKRRTTRSFLRSFFRMFSFKQQNNTGNSQCQDIAKADSPAGTKNGLNIYTGSEDKHRFSLAKLKNRVFFFFF